MTDQNPTQPTRVIKIGATKIIADATMSQLSSEQLRETLKISYPEIAHATMRETTLEDGTVCIEWSAVPGRKG
jgi:hypothetical protein